MPKKTVANLTEADLAGKRVLVRVDFNVPMDKATGAISDDTRIRAALPTIEDLIKKGAKVILCSHMGRPDGQVKENLRLTPVAKRLSELLGQEVIMCPDSIGEGVTAAISQMSNGQVALLENLRFHGEEEANDPDFAKKLAANADLYVNDAFGTAHRAHASTEGVTHYLSPSVAGYLIEKELNYLQAAIETPQRPLAAIIGGSKVSSKIGVIETLLEKCDKLLIGGGMIFTFYKARGLSVGKSLVEEDKLELAKSLEAKAKEKGVEFLLPTDVVLADKFDKDAESQIVKVENIPDGWMGLDIGPESVKVFQEALSNCKSVLWNGPMGVFEFDKFAAGTDAIAHTLADLTATGTTTIIGGGDSVAAVEKVGVAEKMSHISTGGGASLELLEGKVLPGIAALDEA
ncbi:phosphoglycerate kinase [Microcystis aeruginosa]|uniref:Phosphoglycerate kinase n=1 Tax=Microcystis aeruginosa DA14 TaxID=1987506 RepID=A0A3E0MDB8_MICAE|nr:phosphoglycerate kinase [Microcystis aeruginosa]MBE5227683.1 phosphoglycerate kinase [Microcystis aeruginosa PMC 728.11]REJ57568.1 MAG: phosphoglycerate kinase [Microcystis aeruginosa DA14]MDB9386082.1 phosphoglycerate kinase [Microcystis aeruginosa CS-583]ODV40155.1 Phosphoglycerate kinase [Microcystis aeruginosa NIES-98]ROH98445.1 phosphoglycerate kinase [Microcystis aeruginosa FACHB-524]